MADERYLVVGACGLTGRHIVADILRGDPDARVFALDARAALPGILPDGVKVHQVDITDAAAVARAMREIRPTVMFHTASPRAVFVKTSLYDEINIGGTRNLLAAATEVGTLKAMVYTSSSSVVHDLISDLDRVDESARVLFRPEQRGPYQHSKAVAETTVLEANRKGNSNLLTCSLRPASIFGPGDDQAIPRLVQSAKDGKFKWQIGDGKNLFDWTYVENLARAHVLAAQCLLKAHGLPVASIPQDKRVDGEAFFITNDEPMPFWDFARSVGAAAGYPTDPSKITTIPKQFAMFIGMAAEWIVWAFSLGYQEATFNRHSLMNCTIARTFDISKAKQRLGYYPSITIQEGIERTVAGVKW